MDRKVVTSNMLLLAAAIIWGCAFVPQKIGMSSIGPFWFTGLRFALGTLLIIPLLRFEKIDRTLSWKDWSAGIVIGLILFGGINLQQIALKYASVANTGFITGLYVALVPIVCSFLGHRYSSGVWMGVSMATAGLYLLSVHGNFEINPGDLLTLASAFFWAFQLIALSTFGHRLPSIRLAIVQSGTCAVLSLAIAIVAEPISLNMIYQAGIPLLYGSVLSVAIGFTLQILAQRHIKAAHSAIILSIESVFAAFAGWLILGESLGSKEIIGCALILIGTILSQLSPEKQRKEKRNLAQEAA
ncbi:DMT family transporter [Pseudomonas sp. N3-W]|uniref:DMT family transporter n=1 Tax=Pseudomonas fungipugnans TaxID=3024217 RepID=A0ABT6QGW3_9PSED|nr:MULTISPECIES: DMT family transporter [unclassified Pseudomonas]MDI2590126.1 DMT family transporter [Pseudomonas sp. 681]UWF46693.1 DMT family transporter [Pseudomonas sp. N3-W]